MIIQITYELKDQDKNYSELYARIESLGEALHVLRDSWWVDIADSKIEITNLVQTLREYMGEDDLIQLVDISDQKTDGWLAQSSWKWLKERSKI